MSRPKPRTYDRLAPIELLDVTGRPVRIGALIEGRRALLVFLRHFG